MMYGIGIYAIIYYGHAENSEGKQYLGLTLPIWLGSGRHGGRSRDHAGDQAPFPRVLLA